MDEEEYEYDMRPLFLGSALFLEILNVDNDEKVRKLCLKLTKIPDKTFFKLFNDHVKLMFSTRNCDDVIMNDDILINPDEYLDPYIRLGILCYICIFNNYNKDNYNVLMQETFITTISQIVVDNYIPCVEGNLFNSHILIDLINMMRDNHAFSSLAARFALLHAAKKLNKSHSDLLDEFYAKLIDLFAQLILIEINCMNFKHMSDVLLVSNDIVKFFDVYYEIKNYIVDNYSKCPPLLDKSVMSAIAIITNCILLFQGKLLASDIDSLHWSNMICRMEKLRDQMAILDLPPSSGTSLQRFLIDRMLGNFNTNCTKKLYNVTSDTKQINISERHSECLVTTSLSTFMLDINDLMWQVNNMCSSFNIKHRFIDSLFSDGNRYTSGAADLGELDDIFASRSEDSDSGTDEETDSSYSDEESSTNGNDDSETD